MDVKPLKAKSMDPRFTGFAVRYAVAGMTSKEFPGYRTSAGPASPLITLGPSRQSRGACCGSGGRCLPVSGQWASDS